MGEASRYLKIRVWAPLVFGWAPARSRDRTTRPRAVGRASRGGDRRHRPSGRPARPPVWFQSPGAPHLLSMAEVLPLLVFDGACAFCRRWVARWEQRTRGRVRALPFQSLPLRRLGLRRRALTQAVALLEPDGRRFEGAEAVFRALLHSPEAPVRWGARAGLLPGVLQTSRRLYRVVARYRMRSARLDKLLFGRDPTVSRHRGVRTLYLRGLGGVFLMAFTSLVPQLRGLWGERGLRPANETLALSDRPMSSPGERIRRMPTLFWFTGADAQTLHRAARCGQVAGLLLLLNVAPFGALATATALYLSFLGIGREFLSFQWDALLVESGVHALLLAPWGLFPGVGQREPAGLAVLAQRLLLFRLNFGSGIGKLQSHDPTWRDGTALVSHHETTPLPTAPGWYAHQLPRWAHKASTRGTLAAELLLPFLSFGPRRLRHLSFLGLNGLQAAIALTGNYGFFNPLSSLLTLWALDDASLGRAAPSALARRPDRPRSTPRELLANAAALPLVALSLYEIAGRFGRASRPLERLAHHARPWMLGSRYALFTSMTGTRPEVEVEGSVDGVHWKPYPFRYKAGRLDVRPRWVAPHMPRLDWQMWFAALGRPPSWFVVFLERLLDGSPEVLSLLADSPFPDGPPRYVRATVYRYRMTSFVERREGARWWKRERLGLYVPPLEHGNRGLQLAREATVLEEV